MYYFIAFLAGSCVVLSMIINSTLAERIGYLESAFMNYFTGLSVSIVLLIILQPTLTTSQLPPLYALLGGAIGVAIVIISNRVIPKIPAIYSTVLIFTGQLFGSLLLDYLINDNFSLGQLIGGSIIFIGILLNVYFDNEKAFKKQWKLLVD